MTRPDESLTVRELYERYATGRPLDVVQRTGYYEGDDVDFDDYDTLESGDVDPVDYLDRLVYEESILSNQESAAHRNALVEQTTIERSDSGEPETNSVDVPPETV